MFTVHSTSFRAFSVFSLLLLVMVSISCSATRGRRKAPEEVGFLGDYSQLAPREGFEAQEIDTITSSRREKTANRDNCLDFLKECRDVD